MTYAEAIRYAARLKARVVETAYVAGECRVNIVLPNGKPRTIRCERP